MSGHLAIHTPCIRGPGRLNKGGYAVLSVNGKPQYQHRIAYQVFVGCIPDGLHIDHLCRNRWCINAAHLETVTQRVNTLRGQGFAAINSKKTHCSNHHLLNERNIYRPPKRPYTRMCVICRKNNFVEYHRRNE